MCLVFSLPWCINISDFGSCLKQTSHLKVYAVFCVFSSVYVFFSFLYQMLLNIFVWIIIFVRFFMFRKQQLSVFSFCTQLGIDSVATGVFRFFVFFVKTVVSASIWADLISNRGDRE